MSFRVRKRLVVFLTIFLHHHYHAYEPERSDIQSRSQEKSPYYSDDNQDAYHTYLVHDRDDDSHEMERSEKSVAIPKSRHETGWKPILRSRDSEALKSLQLQMLRARYLDYLNPKSEPSPSPTENRVQWESPAKPTKHWDYNVHTQIHGGDKRNSEMSATESYRVVEDDKTSEIEKSKAIKSPKMVKEDDIMWMHYGPPSEDEDFARYRTTRRENHEKTFTTSAPTTTEAIRNYHPDMKTSDWLDYGLRYFFNVQPDDGKMAARKMPKNIYEVIDKNNRDNFKPIREMNKQMQPDWYLDKRQRREENRKSDHFDRLIKNADNVDDDSLLDAYNAVYGPDGNTDERDKDFTRDEMKSRLEKEHRDNQPTSTVETESSSQSSIAFIDNSELPLGYAQKPEHDDRKTTEQKYYKEHDDGKPEDDWWSPSKPEIPDDLKRDQKSAKFLGKPIVITESVPEPRLTAEYYRKLFESFGGHEENDIKANLNPKKNLQNDIKHSERNSTSTRNQPNAENSPNEYAEHLNDIGRAAKSYSPNESENSISNQTQPREIRNCSSKAQCTHSNTSDEKIHHKRNGELHRILKIIGLSAKDLMPRTLKTNIFLIKKLLTECYAGYGEQNVDGSSVTCFQKITSRVLDKAIDSDVIKITDTVSLVKQNVTEGEINGNRGRSSSTDLAEVEWLPSIMDKIFKLFSTHSLKLQLISPQEDQSFQVEGRRRHHFRRVFPVIAGIYMTITAVVIPLVFQFMAMMGGKSFVVSKVALIIAVLSSVSKFITGSPEPSYPHHHHHHPPPPPPYHPPVYYDHPPWKKSDKRHKRRRRHYRRVFPIMVGAYMILSTVLIPLGFKFMMLLGGKSLLVSKLSLIIALMGGIKKILGFGTEVVVPSHYPSYPTAAYPPPAYPSYYDPWRRDEFRKISHFYEPTEYSHYSEEIE